MPLFLNPRDIKFFQQKNMEFYKNLFFPVKVYKVKKHEFNNVYGEDPNKEFDAPYEIPAYIPDLHEWQNVMTKFGMDEVRTLRIFFSQDILKAENKEFPNIGDQIEIQNDTYLITQTNPVDYGSNLQIPLSHVCELKRVRFEKPGAGLVITKDY
jgi:hypothetical protein